MAQQGSPPGRSRRQPDLGRRGYDRAPQPEVRPQPEDRPRRAERHARPERRDRPDRQERHDRQPSWNQFNAFGPDSESELPPWAGPSVFATRPGGVRLRPPAPADDDAGDEHPDAWQGEEPPVWPEEATPAQTGKPVPRPRRRSGRRAAAARLRRSRRRIYVWCGLAIAACVVAATVIAITTHHTATKLPYVTALQHGEFKSVPSSCTAVSPAILNQYLPSKGRTTVAAADSSTNSQCSFTVDSKPNFVVLSVAAQSYLPFAAASGDGSASDNALDEFAATRLTLAHPPRKSPLPPATITPLTGLGKHAFMAVALEHVGHIVTDVVTVAMLDRNVIITVGFSGQESGGGFGPVPLSTLQAGAQAVAKNVLAKAQAQPTA